MTCRYPEACRKVETKRNRSDLCLGCAVSRARRTSMNETPRLGRPSPDKVAALAALPEEYHEIFHDIVGKRIPASEALAFVQDHIAVMERRKARVA